MAEQKKKLCTDTHVYQLGPQILEQPRYVWSGRRWSSCSPCVARALWLLALATAGDPELGFAASMHIPTPTGRKKAGDVLLVIVSSASPSTDGIFAISLPVCATLSTSLRCAEEARLLPLHECIHYDAARRLITSEGN
ncbi:unnamed protein product [Tetraodon nigroviridis]|uniref:(spotted green pufferfish) hypothetical protein n=1 Tax=Tetraodon nigroviridis TaxID=99883 RepID=Q4SI69_TETNG|nr:unnamed protein product [Tetraodon nigroviridis]